VSPRLPSGALLAVTLFFGKRRKPVREVAIVVAVVILIFFGIGYAAGRILL